MTSTPATTLPVVWEDVPCPLCEGRAEIPVLETRGVGARPPFRLVRCGRCSFAYLNPRPDQKSIAQFYPDDYAPYHRGEHRPPASRWRTHLRRLAAWHRCGTPPRPHGWGSRLLARLLAPWLAPHADSLTCLPYHGQGRLLEYGCGAGWLGHRLRGLGWDVTGMDVNPFAAEQARRRFGLPVIVGTLPHPAVPPQSYDVIVMGAVLEHVHRPHDVIDAAAQALRPGGYLVISVPNFDSWGFRRFRDHWWGLQLPVHLLHFTPATLRRLLEAHRLEVRRESQPVRAGWMRRSLAAARRHHQPGPSWLRALGWSRLAAGLLTRWTAASGRGDCLLMIAHRPENIPSCRAG